MPTYSATVFPDVARDAECHQRMQEQLQELGNGYVRMLQLLENHQASPVQAVFVEGTGWCYESACQETANAAAREAARWRDSRAFRQFLEGRPKTRVPGHCPTEIPCAYTEFKSSVSPANPHEDRYCRAHTPGPWGLTDTDPIPEAATVVVGGADKEIAWVLRRDVTDPNEVEANARLIAKAPALLDFVHEAALLLARLLPLRASYVSTLHEKAKTLLAGTVRND